MKKTGIQGRFAAAGLSLLVCIACLAGSGRDRHKQIERDSSAYMATLNKARGDTNALVLDSILSINLENFVGKPVDSLLQKLPVSPHTLRFDVADNPRVVSSLVITYDNWYWVRIVVKKYRYMQPYNANKAWDIDLFRKEKVSWIFVNRGNTCVYGCESTRFRN